MAATGNDSHSGAWNAPREQIRLLSLKHVLLSNENQCGDVGGFNSSRGTVQISR